MRNAAVLSLLLFASLIPAPEAGGQAGPSASPSDPKNFTWVREGVLAVGGGGLTKSQVDWLDGQGFRAIADFRAEHQDPEDYIEGKGMTFLDLPVEHAVDINATQLAEFVAWAAEQEAAGRPMYIHCVNGWHRGAAFAVAWEMANLGISYDEAAKRAVERRPGTTMRAPLAGLQYEARLTGQPQLSVLLVSPASRPENGSEMPVTVEVLANGGPIANAQVKVWSEESRLGLRGTTDAQGRFTFTYKAPANESMDHLYARASAPGYADGADNVQLFYFMEIERESAVELTAERTDAGLYVKVRTDNGRRVPARVVATAPGWSAFDVSALGEVMLPLPPEGVEVDLRANTWGAEQGFLTLAAQAPPPTPSPTTVPTPTPTPSPAPTPTVQEPPTPVATPSPAPTPAPSPATQQPRPVGVVGPTPGEAPASEPAASAGIAAALGSIERTGLLASVGVAALVAACAAGLYLASRRRAGSGRS